MSVLLIAEHDNSELKPFTLNAITAASKIDGDVHVLVAGANCENVTKEVASVSLVKKVLWCDSPNYQNYLDWVLFMRLVSGYVTWQAPDFFYII